MVRTKKPNIFLLHEIISIRKVLTINVLFYELKNIIVMFFLLKKI